jgi:FG-GAP repeat
MGRVDHKSTASISSQGIAAGTDAPDPETLIETKLQAEAGVGGDQFGFALGISGDVLVIAAPDAAGDAGPSTGAVYVFQRNSTGAGWVENKRLLPDGGDFDSLEMSIAVDGDTIAVGAPYARIVEFQEGAVYIFERDAGGPDNWGQVAMLTEPGIGFGGHFGGSVALQGDLLVAGASAASDHHGWVRIFERNHGGAGNWGTLTTLDYGAAQDAGYVRAFGSAVAIDGDLLLIGAADTDVSYLYQGDGAAYIFRRSQADADRWDYVTRLVAPGADQCTGGRTLSEFWVQSSPEEKTEAQRCAREDLKTGNDDFGNAVVLGGDLAVIGARFAEGPDDSYSAGAAHVFQRDADGSDHWHWVAKLVPGSASAGAYFGSALAMAADTVIVGAQGMDIDDRSGQGMAWVFQRDAAGPDTWGQVEALSAGDGLSYAYFGTAVALDGQARIVGAKGDGDWRGAVYIFAPPAAPDEPQNPAFPPTGELVNGGIAEGPAGVLLGALEATLSQALPIWIEQVDTPAEPLWPQAAPVGEFYNIGAVQTTTAAEDEPFGLAVPVPEGADTDHLAIAVLGPPNPLFDYPGTGAQWFPVSGVFNPDSGLFSIALYTLFIQGSVVVLVQHPDVASLPVPVAAKFSASQTDIAIYCFGFTDPDGCLAKDEKDFAERLQQAYDKYTGLGYSDPALNKAVMTTSINLGIVKFAKSTTIYGGNLIKDGAAPPCYSGPEASRNPLAHYEPYSRIITFCYRRDSDETAVLDTAARHEMFHAFQHHFTAFYNDLVKVVGGDANNLTAAQKAAIEDIGWILEATAAAAEDSAQAMSRSIVLDRLLHPINVALTASHYAGNTDPYWIEYRAQDFWVYFGLKKGLGLDYLKSLFERGATPVAADAFFIEEHQTSLGAQYWGWVKNQAMEKSIDFAGKLTDPCHLETDLIGTPRVLLYPGMDGPTWVEGTLPRLTSEVVQIIFSSGEAGETTITATVTAAAMAGAVEGLAYKVYIEGEQSCAALADGERLLENERLPLVVYVILSNTQYQPDSLITYRVSILAS